MFTSKLNFLERLFLVLFCYIFEAVNTTGFRHDFESAFSDCDEMVVNQDGPVTMDMLLTFTARLNCSFDYGNYTFIFEDTVIPAHRIKVNGQKNVSVSIVYPDNLYRPGQYLMTVASYIVMVDSLYIKIASKNISFTLTEYITGNFSISGVTAKYDKLYAPTGNSLNMTVSLHYPHSVYGISELSYLWSIGRDQLISSVPYVQYSFLHPGAHNVHVAVVARIPVYNLNGSLMDVKYKWGSFDKEVNAKEPFHAINLTGNTYLQHGQLFNVNVSCNGSGPYEYCWKVLQPTENLTNFTCLSPVITNQCNFPIIYYFHQSGNYQVAIRIDNFVTEMQRTIEVHIYDVLKRAQLSTVIIPLCCSVLVILIIAVGVMLHVRRNQQIDIETADFDFLQSDTCVIETFWERLYHSVLNVLWIGHSLSVQPHLLLKGAERMNSHDQYDSMTLN